VSETVFLNVERFHSSFPLFPFSTSGYDEFSIDISQGQQVIDTTLTTIESGGTAITEAPYPGQTGSGSVQVFWWCGPFGSVSYEITVTADAISAPKPDLVFVSGRKRIKHFLPFKFMVWIMSMYLCRISVASRMLN
jgi:hypothetical protein